MNTNKLKTYYNIRTHQLVKVDLDNHICYTWDGNTPFVANIDELRVVNTDIKQERKRDIVYKTRWEIALVVFIVCLFITIWNIDINDDKSDTPPIEQIERIQKMITNFDTQNKNSFGDWRTCKIISESIGKSDSDIQKVIENNYLEIKK